MWRVSFGGVIHLSALTVFYFVVGFNGQCGGVSHHPLLCMSMTVTERLSFDEYSELEWATASTNPNEPVLVLGLLFFLVFFL